MYSATSHCSKEKSEEAEHASLPAMGGISGIGACSIVLISVGIMEDSMVSSIGACGIVLVSVGINKDSAVALCTLASRLLVYGQDQLMKVKA